MNQQLTNPGSLATLFATLLRAPLLVAVEGEPCTSDADCAQSAACYDVPNDGAPGEYATTDLVCWPPGLVGAVEGYVVLGVDGEPAMQGSSSDSSGSADGGAVAVPVLVDEETNTDGDEGDAPPAGDDRDGSSVAIVRAPMGGKLSTWVGLGLVFLGLRRGRTST